MCLPRAQKENVIRDTLCIKYHKRLYQAHLTTKALVNQTRVKTRNIKSPTRMERNDFIADSIRYHLVISAESTDKTTCSFEKRACDRRIIAQSSMKRSGTKPTHYIEDAVIHPVVFLYLLHVPLGGTLALPVAGFAGCAEQKRSQFVYPLGRGRGTGRRCGRRCGAQPVITPQHRPQHPRVLPSISASLSSTLF